MKPDDLWPLNPYRRFRYLLTLTLLDARQPLTIRQLAARLGPDELWMGGRPSKVISDALRWERRRGRVVRVARGIYAAGRIPRSTIQWMRQRIELDTQRSGRPAQELRTMAPQGRPRRRETPPANAPHQ